MGMPYIPQSSLSMTQQEAINLVIASVGEEELALAHIINAEGEKIQAAVAAYNKSEIALSQLLDINDSVKEMLKDINKTNILLEEKLSLSLTLLKM